MSLLEDHKTERRDRICRAARKLVGERGYAGLTMRDLARAARVSVPTLYNLFGSKDAILLAELQSIAGSIARAMPAHGDSFLARGLATWEAGMRIIEDSPELFRACIQMFLTSPTMDESRRRTEDAFIAITQANLELAKQAGQLARWADPAIVARHMHAQHMAVFLAWGLGQLDFETFRLASLSGACHLLAGVARGPFHEEVVARLQSIRPVLASQLEQEAIHARSRDR